MANARYREYLFSLVGDFRDNPKRLWSFIKSLKSSQPSLTTLVDQGRCYTNQADCANMFNRSFSSKFSDPHVAAFPEAKVFDTPSLSEFNLPPGKVLKLLQSIGQHKACGPDGLSARILKECARELAIPISILCKLSLAQGVFPSAWKEANIIPIHKKGNKKCADNYRGISLLPLCSKILEKVVFDCLLSHCLPVLPQGQHGFLPRRSCVSNLSCFLRHGWDSIQRGAQTDAIYTDYSSAFTSVNHALLLHKLKTSFNITGLAYSWIGSYLSGRRQRVVLNGKLSDWAPVTSGVPEGSICGPLLFICFTSDISYAVRTNCIMYADDVKLYHRVKSAADADALQADLNRLAEWSHIWRLKLNPSKCHTISFTLRKSPVVHNYSLNGTALERRNETRDLGVILDAKLTFASHVDSTVSKANRMLGLLIRSMQLPRLRRSSRLDHRALICAYNAHVRSLLEYGSVVWSGTADTHLKRLERVQHRFLTWLAFRSDRPSADLGYEALLAHFNMCSVKARFIQHDVMFLYNVHHGRIDCPDLVSMFGLSVPSRLTRNPSLWAIPFARVNTVLRSLLCRVPAHTNSFLGSGSSADLFTSTHHSFLTGVRTFASRGGTYM